MLLLPRIAPPDYKARWQAFADASEYLELTPADRNLAWREWTHDEHFHEWPVPVEHFVRDPFYVGTNVVVRPKVREFMADFADPDNLFELFCFIAGIGAGKSFSASLLLMYSLYSLSCMRRPQRYLSSFPGVQLSGDAEIVVLNASGAGARQAAKVVYGEVFEKVERSPYFRRFFEPYPNKITELEFPHRIRFSPGTGQARSVLGFNVYCFVIDEAAFGTENVERDTDSVRDLFLALNQRRRSRFGRLGWGGLFTSPQAEHAFVEVLAGEGAVAGSDVLVRRITTWDAKDELQPGTPVFLLDRNPDSTRVMETELIYVGAGVAQRKNGELVRFGKEPPSERQAQQIAADFEHTHGRAA